MKNTFIIITKKFRDAEQQKSYFFADVIEISGMDHDLKWLLSGPEIIGARIAKSKRHAQLTADGWNKTWEEAGQLADCKMMNRYYGVAA